MPREDNDLTIVDEDLLPEGASLVEDDDDNIGFDINNLRVDFTGQEAASTARTYETLPSGKYHVCVTDIDVKTCGPDSKNPGKPFYALVLTIQDGKFENRKIYGCNVMLFAGALYTVSQIMKALDMPVPGSGGNVRLPSPEEIQGQHFYVTGLKTADKWKIDNEQWTPGDGTEKPTKFEVKGFMKYDGTSHTDKSASAGDPMMP